MKRFLPIILIIVGLLSTISFWVWNLFQKSRIYIFFSLLLFFGCEGSAIVLIIANAKDRNAPKW